MCPDPYRPGTRVTQDGSLLDLVPQTYKVPRPDYEEGRSRGGSRTVSGSPTQHPLRT